MARQRGRRGESSIVRDKAGVWHGWVSMGVTPSGRRVRRHVRGTVRKEVLAEVRRLEGERTSVAVPDGGKVTVSAWLTTWIAGRTTSVRPKTLVGYHTDQKHIDAAIGGVLLSRLTPEHVEKLYADMAELGLAVGSVLHVRRTLSAALSTAVARGRIARNVVKLAAMPRDDPPEVEPLSLAEAQAVMDAAKGRRNGVRWLIALALGLRQGEALGLQWADIDWDAGTLWVRRALQRRPWRHGCSAAAPCRQRPKDCPLAVGGGLVATATKTRSSRRMLALPGPLMAALAEHRRAQAEERTLAGELWVDGDWVFATEVGTSIDPRNDLREWVRIVAIAGIRRVRIHDLRHSSATLQLVAGTDSRTLQGLFGWSSPVLVARYAHVVEQAKRDAAQRIGQVLWADS